MVKDISWLVLTYIDFGFVLAVVLLIAQVFTIIKRFHDRDKPWPWWFMVFAPYIAACGSSWNADAFRVRRGATATAPIR